MDLFAAEIENELGKSSNINKGSSIYDVHTKWEGGQAQVDASEA